MKGHAYSILAVKSPGKRRFLQLRNPWGTFSWEGDWSDKSAKWTSHPDVASALGWAPEATDDGVFWMTLEDFVKFFDAVDIMDREVTIKDVVLTIDEADGPCLGPLKGCLGGCFSYWCCCEGASKLCCPHIASRDTVKVRRCCPCSCCGEDTFEV